MGVQVARIPARTVEQVTTGKPPRPSVLDQPGGPLDSYRFAPADRDAASWLIVELRNCSGSADGRDFVPPRFGWRTLRNCSPQLLERALRRVERVFGGTWTLPPGPDIHSRIEAFFEGARR